MNNMHKVAISMKILVINEELKTVTNPLRRKYLLQKIEALQLKARLLTT